jgi:hypothetical protein
MANLPNANTLCAINPMDLLPIAMMHLAEIFPLYVIHGEIVLALVLADFVDADDIRMTQAGSRLGFGPKALQLGFTRQLPGQNHLHRDDSVQAYLPRFENHAHAAARNFFQEFVVAEITNSCQWRVVGCVCGQKHKCTHTIRLRQVVVGLEYSATYLHLRYGNKLLSRTRVTSSNWVHFDRAAGGDRHHRDPGKHVVARTRPRQVEGDQRCLPQ